MAVLPHTIDELLVSLSPRWTLLRAAEHELVHLLGRLLTQEWSGFSAEFRKESFRNGVGNEIGAKDMDVVSWWMCQYLPWHEDLVGVAAMASSFGLKALQWLNDQDMLPLDHSAWSQNKNCYSSEAARWILKHEENLILESKSSLELMQWVHTGAARQMLKGTPSLLDRAIGTGNMEMVGWFHWNRPE